MVSMFPHTVTLYNISTESNPATYKDDETAVYITILKGVLLDASKAVNVNKSGLTGADAVNLYIPFGVEAVDGFTGAPKTYMGPLEFWRAEDRSGAWTLYLEGEGDKDSKTHELTFFVKGVALPPPDLTGDAAVDYVQMMYDNIYNVTKVDMKDFGGLKHFQVGGN